MPVTRFRLPLLLVFASLLAGCRPLPTETEERLTIEVAPYTVECQGMTVQQCMLVRYSAGSEWTYFYGVIEGFTYEPGFTYTLRVLRREIPNPPQDGSSVEYRLIQIVAKVPA